MLNSILNLTVYLSHVTCWHGNSLSFSIPSVHTTYSTSHTHTHVLYWVVGVVAFTISLWSFCFPLSDVCKNQAAATAIECATHNALSYQFTPIYVYTFNINVWNVEKRFIYFILFWLELWISLQFVNSQTRNEAIHTGKWWFSFLHVFAFFWRFWEEANKKRKTHFHHKEPIYQERIEKEREKNIFQ